MGRKTSGTLFKRGRFYYLRYQLDGKRIDRALRTEDGHPITDLPAAEDARLALLSPLAFKDKAQQRREIAKALRTAEDEAKEAEQAANERREREEAERNKLPIAAAWDRYPYTENTRGKTKRRLAAGTVRDNASHWAAFAAWAAENGIVAVEDITEDHAAAFSRHLRDRMTGNRHNKIMYTCSVVCCLSGRANPFAKTGRYEPEPVHRENLEPDEIRRVIATATGELRRLFIIGAYTGLRLGDCVTLQWGDVHLAGDGSRIIRTTGKTRKTVRLAIHPELLTELERTPAGERTGDVCPELAEVYRYHPIRLSRQTRKTFGACGLVTRAKDKDGRAVTASLRGFHSFRHSFATECARGGIPLGLVQEWLGHASPEITRIYENWKIDRDGARVLAALPSLALPETAAADLGKAPGPGQAVVVETERDQLARLARELPAAKIRQILAIAAGLGATTPSASPETDV